MLSLTPSAQKIRELQREKGEMLATISDLARKNEDLQREIEALNFEHGDLKDRHKAMLDRAVLLENTVMARPLDLAHVDTMQRMDRFVLGLGIGLMMGGGLVATTGYFW